MRRWIAVLFLVVSVALGGLDGVSAQTSPGQGRGSQEQGQSGQQRQGQSQQGQNQSGQGMSRDEREQAVQRLQRQFGDQMARELRLTSEQRTAIEAIFERFEGPRRQIAAEKRRLLGESYSFLSGSRPEERGRTLLTQLGNLRQRENKLLEDEEAQLLEVLSASQVLALQLFREQFGDRIRGVNSPFGFPGGSQNSGGQSPFRTR